MPVVSVQDMIEAIRQDMLLITLANGYTNTIKNASLGYRQLSENNNDFVTAFLFPGTEKVIDEGNNNVPAYSEIEIFISIQSNKVSNQKDLVALCSSLKKDLKRFVYQLEVASDKWIFSSLATMTAAGVIWKGWSLDEIDSGFEWKENRCELFCSLKVMYNTEAGALAVGDTPVLTSPSDTATEQPTATIFNWTGTGLTYEIQIATDSGFMNTVVSQAGLTSSSYTIPADLLLSNSTVYYWRVRSTNVLSAWSTARSFTTAAASVADYTTNLIADWDADSGVTSSGGLVSAWLDSVGGYNFVQATAGLKPTLVANALNSTKSIIQLDGTKYMDLAAAINLVNFTVIIVFKSDNATPAGREFILGGAVQGILGMATVAQGNHTYGWFVNPSFRTVAYSAADINAYHIRSFQNAKLYSNGTEGTYQTSNTATALSLSRLGCRGDNTSQTFTGKIARIRIYSGQLSTTNRAIAETYLNSLYAIY